MSLEKIKEEIFALAKVYADELSKEQASKEKRYIPASGKSIGSEELINMIDASLDMWLTAGRFNKAFEEEFAKFLGVKYALSTNSGSSANLLAFSALTSHKLKERALKKGDEVISVAGCFPTTLNPIIIYGLVPVFVDMQVETYNIDVDRIEKCITDKTKAIFIAHTLGNMYDMDKIIDLAKKYNLWVIEDSCDALGATWNGKYAGTIGDIGTYSFYPAHHITMGEGGAVVTSNPILKKIILSMRDWGRDCWCEPGCDNTCKNRFNMQLGKLPFGYDHKYTYSHIGYNLKITDHQAAIGLAQLKKLNSFLDIRRANANRLLDKLSDLQEYLILPSYDKLCNPSWFGFLISCKEGTSKLELVKYLEENGVGTRQLFAGNILMQPMLTDNHIPIKIEDSEILYSDTLNETDYEKLKNTNFIMNNTFWVGVAQNNNLSDMDRISKIMYDFFKK